MEIIPKASSAELAPPERLTIKAPALVHAIAFRPDGRQLAAGLSTLGPGPGNDVLF